MLMPSIFGENLLDDFFGEPFGGYDYSESGLMTTDVKDTDKGYEVTMNMPGVKKEDVKAELKDGYLTVSAETNTKKDAPGVVAYITKCLSELGINIAFMRLFRESKGNTAYTIVESDDLVPEDIADTIRRNKNVYNVMVVQM